MVGGAVGHAQVADRPVSIVPENDVRVFRSGALAADLASEYPPEVDPRTLCIDKTAIGYVARVGFDLPFRILDDIRGRPARYTVAASFIPPSGPLMRLALQPDGTGSLDRATGETTVEKLRTITRTITGREVAFDVPADLGVNPGWEARAVAYLVDAAGDGFHGPSPRCRWEPSAAKAIRSELVSRLAASRSWPEWPSSGRPGTSLRMRDRSRSALAAAAGGSRSS